MKNKILVLPIIFFTFSIFAESTVPSPSKKTKPKIIFKKKEINNCKCQDYFGVLLDECMNELDEKEYVDNFKHLKTHQRKRHLGRTINSVNDYIKFVNRFIKYETEWQKIWEQLTPEEQKFFPKTKSEQQTFVNKMIEEYNSASDSIETDRFVKRLAIGSFICSIVLDGLAPGSSTFVRAAVGTYIANQTIDDGKEQKAQYFPKKKQMSGAFILEKN